MLLLGWNRFRNIWMGCLVTNLVVLWNTVHLQQVIEALRTEGIEVRDEWPTFRRPALSTSTD